ncbi:MAG: Rid family detoxifying hydrolase [Actinomycetota bacterium]|nr:Rid family detoxifying hydrolase [Actinomycetota bacterium]
MPKKILDAPSAPAPVGPYSVVTEANGFVFVSGQVGMDTQAGRLVEGGVEAEAHQTMKNIGAILADIGLTYSDIAKTTVFLADMADFPVVNAAYGEYVADAKPARSTVQVAGLPLGVQVEIEVIAAR